MSGGGGGDRRSGVASGYLDFEVEVGVGVGREYPVAVRSPAGEARETLRLPFDDLALENRLLAVQNVLLRGIGLTRAVARPPEERTVEAFGRALFEALLPGQALARYDVCRQLAREQGKGLRLRLRLLDSALAALPWELLYDARRGDYVCLSQRTPLVRHLELPEPVAPLAVAPPLRVLGLVASPPGLPALDVAQERARVERALGALTARGLVEVVWLPGQTWRALQEAMWAGPWHVFHFVGHGGFDPDAGEGHLALAQDEEGAAGGGGVYRLSARSLGRLLADHESVRLAVLNACEGARGSGRDVFSGTAATLVRTGLPAVVAMQYAITDRAAIEFARTLYLALARALPVDAAVAAARQAVSLAAPASLEWATPVLYLRSPDAVLFGLGGRPAPEEGAAASSVQVQVPPQPPPANAASPDESNGDASAAEAPRVSEPVGVFYAYAHADGAFRDELEKHLALLRRQGVIREWHDRRIGAGVEWAGQIDAHLDRAGVILLLVSPDFLASDYCYSVELERAMQRHEAGEARVIPVVLRPCDWQEAPFGRLQALPRDAKPVTRWTDRDEAFLDVARGLRRAAAAVEATGTRAAAAGAPGPAADPRRSRPAGRRAVEFVVEVGDIRTADADVVVLKHAQGFYGADRAVAAALAPRGPATAGLDLRLRLGEYTVVPAAGALTARHALFLGTAGLHEFSYPQIRAFAAEALARLAQRLPHTRSAAMTIHGVGYGLDETESLLAQLAGCLDAVRGQQVPLWLERVAIIEQDVARATRLRSVLRRYLAELEQVTPTAAGWAYTETPPRAPAAPPGPAGPAAQALARAGAEASPHVFVAMPSGVDHDDTFFYGIQRPVRDRGFLCERVGQESFTAEGLERMRSRIETAVAVIAELTGADPNVYLELGYAWGRGKPTILLVRDATKLRFDARGHRCLVYDRIRDLEEQLTKELQQLRP